MIRCFGQCEYAPVRNQLALDKANPSKLRERRQLLDTLIGKTLATCQVDISYSIAQLHKLYNCVIRNLGTMPQMYVVQILAQFCDGHDGSIRYLFALCEYKITKSGRGLDDLFHRLIMELMTSSKIQDTEALKSQVLRQIKESRICEKMAVPCAELSKLPSTCN